MSEARRKLGEILLSEGVITPDHLIDALQVQQVRKHQARGARANDANLCPYHCRFFSVIIPLPVDIGAWSWR